MQFQACPQHKYSNAPAHTRYKKLFPKKCKLPWKNYCSNFMIEWPHIFFKGAQKFLLYFQEKARLKA